MRATPMRRAVSMLLLAAIWLTAAEQTLAIDSNRVFTIVDIIQERHIDPPVEQQMLLAGVKAVYAAKKESVPRGLSQQISELADRAARREFLEEFAQDAQNTAAAERHFVRGMLAALPGFGALVEGAEGRVQAQLAANRYVGTGIALAMNGEKKPLISKVFYEGPAWKAGIKEQDIILAIDGQPTDSKNLRTVVDELRGESGSDVTMLVKQPGEAESRALTVTRGRVFIPSVEGHRELPSGQWEYRLEEDEQIAYLRIKSIGPSTLHELRKIDETLRADGVSAVILDIRPGGGLLHDVVMVADSLLDGGVIGHLQTVTAKRTYEAKPGALFHGLPMAVLVARNTHTDRVFLAAALQDHGRAVVVGEPTQSETYVSELVSVPGEDAQVKVATGVLYRGDGTPLLVGRGQQPSVPHLQVGESVERDQKRRRPSFVMPNHFASGHQRLGEDDGQAKDRPDPIVSKAVQVLQQKRAASTPAAG